MSGLGRKHAHALGSFGCIASVGEQVNNGRQLWSSLAQIYISAAIMGILGRFIHFDVFILLNIYKAKLKPTKREDIFPHRALRDGLEADPGLGRQRLVNVKQTIRSKQWLCLIYMYTFFCFLKMTF